MFYGTFLFHSYMVNENTNSTSKYSLYIEKKKKFVLFFIFFLNKSPSVKMFFEFNLTNKKYFRSLCKLRFLREIYFPRKTRETFSHFISLKYILITPGKLKLHIIAFSLTTNRN